MTVGTNRYHLPRPHVANQLTTISTLSTYNRDVHSCLLNADVGSCGVWCEHTLSKFMSH